MAYNTSKERKIHKKIKIKDNSNLLDPLRIVKFSHSNLDYSHISFYIFSNRFHITPSYSLMVRIRIKVLRNIYEKRKNKNHFTSLHFVFPTKTNIFWQWKVLSPQENSRATALRYMYEQWTVECTAWGICSVMALVASLGSAKEETLLLSLIAKQPRT